LLDVAAVQRIAADAQKPENSTGSEALNRVAHSGSTLPSEV
jgi:hypothetical protein